MNNSTTFRWLAAVGVCALLMVPEGAVPPALAGEDHYPRETLPNSAGGNLDLACARGRLATVLVCLAVDCPISNEYLPTINQLAKRYKARGVTFVGIHPRSVQSLDEMAGHAREHGLAFPYVKDTEGKVTRDLSFKVTPEVCVFDRAGRQVYRGRVDDRYRAGAGGKAASADLARALDEVLAGKPVSVTSTKAVGCPILSQ